MTKATIANWAVALLFIAWIILLPAGCNGNNAGSSGKIKNKVDTSMWIGKFLTAGGDQVLTGEFLLYTYSVATPDSNDLSKNIVRQDTSAAVPSMVYVQDSLTGKLILDSLGKPVTTYRYVFVPKNTVWPAYKVDTSQHRRLSAFIRKPINHPDSIFIKQGQ